VATYLTTPFPGEEPTARLLGTTPRGHLAILTCLGPADSALLEELREATAPVPRSPFLATLLELGTRGGQLWAVERAAGVHTLGLVLKRAAAIRQPLHDALCARIAFRILEATSALGRPHGRLTPQNVLLLQNGEIQVLGAQYAHRMEPRAAELAYQDPRGEADPAEADLFGALQIARALALRRAPRTGELGPAPLEALLPASLDAQPSPEVARTSATELAAFMSSLGLPATDPTRAPMELSTVSIVPEETGELLLPEEDPEADQFQPGPAMDADGRIELSSLPKPAWPASRPRPAMTAASLELDPAAVEHAFGSSREPSPELANPAAPPRRARSLRRALGLALASAAAAGAIGVGAFAMRDRLPSWFQLPPAHPGAYGKAMLRIESEPTGATVRVGDEDLGVTPYMADNDYPEGSNPVTLELKGYQPFRASFPGGRDFTIRASLKRRDRSHPRTARPFCPSGTRPRARR
jgi:hypothetical protein